ncbi:alpha/beta hydrolase [Spirosoma sp. HMF4905]|uniref:Alpha/beta hydrolase n=1 Tax=Spirosoma arboris TaxID=2682092 RepID=A0A7K1SDW7_9BACT|nr:alpha/beta hydrolase-fold protein [Spirosoma arboris]MVM32002.1 alpha/beta hydrolase [Spirosoma arboris]
MKNLALLLVFSALSFAVYAQTDNRIVMGTIDSVQSKILNEKRKIWIHVPDSGPAGIYTKKRYPVVYLLDGDAHFSSVVGMIEQLSSVNGNMVCPEMIVVAIPNTDRTRDLTPTRVESDPPFMDKGFSKNSGGGEKFISFIEKELMPRIDSLYPTQSYKMLIGHSFGGLAVMQALTKHTNLFNAYVAIDPSMWYDKQKFLAETKKELTNKKYAGIALYVGIANTMNDGMTLLKLPKDTTASTRHIRSIFDLDRYVKANAQNGLRYQSKYYENDTHGSVPLITEYDALHFIFNYYNLKLTQKDFTDTTTAIVDKYERHFANVSKQLGYKVSPSEGLINSLGYGALANKNVKKAERLFKLNVAHYPDSYNVYDSYGDYFMAQKDTLNAITQFKKALILKENPESRQKLDALLGTKPVKLTADELKKYVGEFQLGDMLVKTFVSKDVLNVSVPGQPDNELEPTKPNEFKVKNRNGYFLQFEMNGDKPTAFNATTPDGQFKATIKK